jgi:hypothetical protein
MQAATGKTAGALFLELLSVGTGVDIFGIKGAGSDSQTGSDTESDSTQEQDAKSLASAFQAELSAGKSAANSALEKATEQDQSSAQQTSGQQNGQSLNTNLPTTAAPNLGSLVPPTNGVQLLFSLQAVSYPTGKAGKQQAQQGAGQAAIDTVSSLATAIISQQTNLSREKAAVSQAPTGSTQTADTSISAVIQPVANHDRQPLADASQAEDCKAQQDANPQIITNAARMLQSSFAAEVPAAAQTDPLIQSDEGTAATSDNGASATQSASDGPKLATNPTIASTFLSAAIFPSSIDPTPSAGKANQFKITPTTFNANSNLSNATTAMSTAKTSSQDSSGTSSRSNQTDASQATSVAARPADSGASQTIAFGAIAAPHQTASSHAVSGSFVDEATRRTDTSASLPSDQSNGAGSGATSGINSARLIQSINETEMHVGMHSSEFGDISIRTMVSQQQVQAQISVDHNELSSALSAHIPAMQAKLGNEYGLHASIEVSQNGASFSSGERGQSSERDQKAFVPSIQVEGTTASAETNQIVLRTPSVSATTDRLDIRA